MQQSVITSEQRTILQGQIDALSNEQLDSKITSLVRMLADQGSDYRKPPVPADQRPAAQELLQMAREALASR